MASALNVIRIPGFRRCVLWTWAILLLVAAGPVVAAPIYVFKEADGVIRFTSKPPPPGVRAEVFTGQGLAYSILGGGSGWRTRLCRECYRDIIAHMSQLHKVEAALIRSVIHAESAFNPHAVSPKGARGLMQLMPDTARRYGVTNVFDPSQNIGGGTRHLAGLLQRYRGDMQRVLAAYNAGEEAVERYRGIPPFAETREYVRRVLHLLKRYRAA